MKDATYIEILQVLKCINEAQIAQGQEHRNLGIGTGLCSHVIETFSQMNVLWRNNRKHYSSNVWGL